MRAFNTLAQIGTLAVLARLIPPRDFGLVAMVTVGLELLVNFKDAGLSEATIQKKEINQNQVSTLFWLNVLVGTSLTIIMILMAPLLTWFYHEPKLNAITIVLSFTFIFDGLLIQHGALLNRQMQYKKLAIIEVIVRTLSKLIAILLALLGMGYWALVSMPLSLSFLRLILTWFVSKWIPSLPGKLRQVKDMITFGLHMTGINFTTFFKDQMDNILIGRFCGARLLGLYSKSYTIILMPVRSISWPIDSVMIPSLSVLQDTPLRYRSYFRKALETLTFFGQPITVFMFVAATEIILVLLGNQWRGAIPIFQILSLFGLCEITPTGHYLILTSLGKTARLFRWEIFKNVIQSLALIVGLHWGVMGIAISLSVSTLILKFPEIAYCYKNTPIRFRDYWESIWRSTISSLGAGLLIYFLKKIYLTHISHALLRVSIIAVLFGAIYFAFYLLLPGGPQKINETLTRLKGLWDKKTHHNT